MVGPLIPPYQGRVWGHQHQRVPAGAARGVEPPPEGFGCVPGPSLFRCADGGGAPSYVPGLGGYQPLLFWLPQHLSAAKHHRRMLQPCVHPKPACPPALRSAAGLRAAGQDGGRQGEPRGHVRHLRAAPRSTSGRGVRGEDPREGASACLQGREE